MIRNVTKSAKNVIYLTDVSSGPANSADDVAGRDNTHGDKSLLHCSLHKDAAAIDIFQMFGRNFQIVWKQRRTAANKCIIGMAFIYFALRLPKYSYSSENY